MAGCARTCAINTANGISSVRRMGSLYPFMVFGRAWGVASNIVFAGAKDWKITSKGRTQKKRIRKIEMVWKPNERQEKRELLWQAVMWQSEREFNTNAFSILLFRNFFTLMPFNGFWWKCGGVENDGTFIASRYLSNLICVLFGLCVYRMASRTKKNS